MNICKPPSGSTLFSGYVLSSGMVSSLIESFGFISIISTISNNCFAFHKGRASVLVF